ncbi:MAG: protein kinase [Deltaproteobacteria bacterium]|nr:protein kinase [Deltaproteobacteria bacterium]
MSERERSTSESPAGEPPQPSDDDAGVRARVASATRDTLARLGSSVAFGGTITHESAMALAATQPTPLPGTLQSAQPRDGSATFPLLAGQEDLEVFELLAQGGMGQVLLARQRSLQREVAVKTVRPELEGTTASRHLLDESVIAGSLEHPNIIPIHSLGADGAGHPFLVMKRVEGVEWGALIDDDAHPAWARVGVLDGDRLASHLDIFRAVCSAVHYAHLRGVIHRDIKPANVMVGALGEVYLVDWGIASALDPRDARYRMRSLGLVGTPSYMAPEMVSDDGGRADARTDVYLLGATLHYLLTRRPRHAGSSMLEVFTTASISAPATYGREVPAELAAIANRATHPSPDERFPTAAALRAAITEYLAHRASIALSDEAARRLAEVRARALGVASAVGAGDADRPGTRQLLAECRLGFEHARLSWPENPRAKRGLRECALLSLRDELERGNLAGAEELLLDLDDLPRDLGRAVEALREEHRARDARDARHRERERQEDWRLGAGSRVAFFVGLAVVVIGLWMWVNGGEVRHRAQLTPFTLAATAGVTLGLACALAAVARRRLVTSQVNARLVYGVLLTLAAIFANRVAAIFPVAPTATLISTELVVCAYGASLGAVLLARWLWLQVPIWLFGAFLVRAIPDVAGLVFAIAGLLAFGLGLWRVGRTARRAAVTRE